MQEERAIERLSFLLVKIRREGVMLQAHAHVPCCPARPVRCQAMEGGAGHQGQHPGFVRLFVLLFLAVHHVTPPIQAKAVEMG